MKTNHKGPLDKIVKNGIKFDWNEHPICSTVFGSILVVGTQKGLKAYNFNNKEQIQVGERDEVICSMTGNPLTETIWAGTLDGKIIIFNAATFEVIDTVQYSTPSPIEQLIYATRTPPELSLSAGVWVRFKTGNCALASALNGNIVCEIPSAEAKSMQLSQDGSIWILDLSLRSVRFFQWNQPQFCLYKFSLASAVSIFRIIMTQTSPENSRKVQIIYGTSDGSIDMYLFMIPPENAQPTGGQPARMLSKENKRIFVVKGRPVTILDLFIGENGVVFGICAGSGGICLALNKTDLSIEKVFVSEDNGVETQLIKKQILGQMQDSVTRLPQPKQPKRYSKQPLKPVATELTTAAEGEPYLFSFTQTHQPFILLTEDGTADLLTIEGLDEMLVEKQSVSNQANQLNIPKLDILEENAIPLLASARGRNDTNHQHFEVQDRQPQSARSISSVPKVQNSYKLRAEQQKNLKSNSIMNLSKGNKSRVSAGPPQKNNNISRSISAVSTPYQSNTGIGALSPRPKKVENKNAPERVTQDKDKSLKSPLQQQEEQQEENILNQEIKKKELELSWKNEWKEEKEAQWKKEQEAIEKQFEEDKNNIRNEKEALNQERNALNQERIALADEQKKFEQYKLHLENIDPNDTDKVIAGIDAMQKDLQEQQNECFTQNLNLMKEIELEKEKLAQEKVVIECHANDIQLQRDHLNNELAEKDSQRQKEMIAAQVKEIQESKEMYNQTINNLRSLSSTSAQLVMDNEKAAVATLQLLKSIIILRDEKKRLESKIQGIEERHKQELGAYAREIDTVLSKYESFQTDYLDVLDSNHQNTTKGVDKKQSKGKGNL